MPDLVPAMVLGHEYVGELLDYGPDTDRTLAPGSIVTSVPYLDTPDGPQLIGLAPAATGGLAERMVLQESRLLPVPDLDNAAYAALAEPLAVGAHAVGAADMAAGDVALVIGCGPVGVAADFSPGRRALAEKIGADEVVDPSDVSPYIAASRGFDEAAAAFADLRQPEHHCKILPTPGGVG